MVTVIDAGEVLCDEKRVSDSILYQGARWKEVKSRMHL